MLGLKLPTDPRWANIAESNLEVILTDHAWCEQKAVTNAIHIIIQNPEFDDLVVAMMEIAREELEHFKMVHEILLRRGYKFGREQKDDYVNELFKFMRRGESHALSRVDRLLFAAVIEARSCERFKVLSENIKDEALATFYRGLMESEAGHYTTFLKFAKKYGEEVDVDKRWKEWLAHEASVIANYGKEEKMHG
jgi:tRNA-(ms[2]io[6]A)-hydroxylase